MTGNPTGDERHCPDDLVVRGQREPLTEIERRALAAHLDQCAACRAAAALTVLFDAVPDSQPGDADLIARVADKAVRSPRQASRWPVWRVAAIVAFAVLTSGAATAAFLVYRPSSMAPEPPASPPRAHRARRASSAGPSRAEPPLPPPQAVPVPSDEAPPAEPPRARRPARIVAPAPTAMAVPEPSAASLFAEANAIRRGGHVRRAIAVYQALRERFPQSSQAVLAAVSLGDLFLGEGDASSAIAAYGAYLRGAPDGPLTQEALFGRARGLRKLGRVAEERQAWTELVRRFPRSAYQPAASRRLQELTP